MAEGAEKDLGRAAHGGPFFVSMAVLCTPVSRYLRYTRYALYFSLLLAFSALCLLSSFNA